MYDFIVVGAAQAGLSMAYHLKKMNKKFVIVDKESEIGASWLNRWDSLKLFTPSEFNHLEGFNFPAPKGYYPNKYEVADYFKKYVEKFDFPVQLNTLVEGIEKHNGIFTLKHAKGQFQAKNVVIATGPFHLPYTPSCAKKLNNQVSQIHSNYYKSTNQLIPGDTLVVGDGDSGYQILKEVSADKSRQVYFSGNTDVSVLPQKILGKTLWWWLDILGILNFNKHSWIGKRFFNNRQPIIGTNVKGILARENVTPVGMTKDAEETNVYTEKAELSTLKNIIWATGYRPDFTWIDGLELDKNGYPKHYRGVSNIKGVYFLGLPWLYTRGSATLGGVKKDAAYLAEEIRKEV